MNTSLQMLSRRTEIWHIPADSSVGMQDATPCQAGTPFYERKLGDDSCAADLPETVAI